MKRNINISKNMIIIASSVAVSSLFLCEMLISTTFTDSFSLISLIKHHGAISADNSKIADLNSQYSTALLEEQKVNKKFFESQNKYNAVVAQIGGSDAKFDVASVIIRLDQAANQYKCELTVDYKDIISSDKLKEKKDATDKAAKTATAKGTAAKSTDASKTDSKSTANGTDTASTNSTDAKATDAKGTDAKATDTKAATDSKTSTTGTTGATASGTAAGKDAGKDAEPSAAATIQQNLSTLAGAYKFDDDKVSYYLVPIALTSSSYADINNYIAYADKADYFKVQQITVTSDGSKFTACLLLKVYSVEVK